MAIPSNACRAMAATECAAQLGIDAALHDAEDRLVGPSARRERSLRPSMRALHRVRHLGRRQSGIDELVERHRHVRAEQRLDLHRPLRREPLHRSVEVRGERHAVVVHAPQVGEAEHLEAAGVGEDRPVPAHEPMQTAEARDALRGRTQAEVVRVAEDHLRAGGTQVAGREGLHRRLGADRHELRRVDRPVRRHEPAEPGTAHGAVGRAVNVTGAIGGGYAPPE